MRLGRSESAHTYTNTRNKIESKMVALLLSDKANPGGGMRGSVSQFDNFSLPFPPITLNHDHLISCYCLFYVKEYRLKLSNAN